jgi:hypothetical protein
MFALREIRYGPFRAAVVRVLGCTAEAAAATGQAGDETGLCGFFWGVHALLCSDLQQGVRAHRKNQEPAKQHLKRYVTSVAHVANMLVAIHNLLLRGGRPAAGAVEPKQESAAAAAGVAVQPA